MRSQEVLRRCDRLEAVDVPLPPPRRLVRILGMVVPIPSGFVSRSNAQAPVRRAMAPQLVRHHDARRYTGALQELAEETLRGLSSAVCLDQNIQNLPVLIHGTPQIALLALDASEHLVSVPGAPGLSVPGPDSLRVLLADSLAALADRFKGHVHAPTEEDLLNVSETGRESLVQPDGVADDLGGRATAEVAWRW